MTVSTLAGGGGALNGKLCLATKRVISTCGVCRTERIIPVVSVACFHWPRNVSFSITVTLKSFRKSTSVSQNAEPLRVYLCGGTLK